MKEDFNLDELFLEEFEELNNSRGKKAVEEADKQLTFSQEICGGKGFRTQRNLNVDRVMRMNEKKRRL